MLRVDKSWYPLLILITIAVIGLIIQECRKSELLSLEQRYTVGTITQVKVLRKQGDAVTFNYSIDGVEYIINSKFSKSVKVGETYIVTVPVGHEDNGFLLIKHPTPSGLASPRSGWKEIPESLIE